MWAYFLTKTQKKFGDKKTFYILAFTNTYGISMN